jgi:hypothetical protein
MTEDSCPFEARTAQAVQSAQWPDELRTHVAQCNVCEETRAVAGFMRQTALRLGRTETPPDPTLIWLKATLARRDDQATVERRARLWSRGLTGLAAAIVGWAALQWIPPSLMLNNQTLAASGAAIVLTLAILYFAAYRPLKNAIR